MDSNTSLGKGLESLIPKKTSPNGGGASASSQSVVSGNSPAPDSGKIPPPSTTSGTNEAATNEGAPMMLFLHDDELQSPERELPEGLMMEPTEELPTQEEVFLPEEKSVEKLEPKVEEKRMEATPSAASRPEISAENGNYHQREKTTATNWLPPVKTPSAAPVRTFADAKPAGASGKNINKPYEAVFHIEVYKIKPNPHQPRRIFDPEALKELAHSIREFGILQPLVVTKKQLEVPGGTEVEYELIAGERRLEAAKLIGMERVPAVIKSYDLERERLEMAIIENLQRENLSPIEMARAFSRLQDEFRLTQREVANRLGKSRESVANTMRLLDLPPYIQEAVDRKQITESHGRLLLSIDDEAAQQKLFNDLLGNKMTIREFKRRVESARAKTEASEEEAENAELRALQEKLSSELGAPVKISASGETGKITISFYSKEELDSILNKLNTGE